MSQNLKNGHHYADGEFRHLVKLSFDFDRKISEGLFTKLQKLQGMLWLKADWNWEFKVMIAHLDL